MNPTKPTRSIAHGPPLNFYALGLLFLNVSLFGFSVTPAASTYIYCSPAFFALSFFSWFGFRGAVPFRTILVANSLLIAPLSIVAFSILFPAMYTVTATGDYRALTSSVTLVLAVAGFVWHFFAPVVALSHRVVVGLVSLLCFPVTGIAFLFSFLSVTGSYI